MPESSVPARPRLNWFSPLPPARTAIGHYALLVLPVLARYADVLVWTERPYWPTELEAHATVRQWDGKSWAALNSADATLYHVGNNARFHGWILDVARLHPGIVVLHETRLHELFAARLLDAAPDETAYLNAVRRCHGMAAVLHAQRFVRGESTAGELADSIPLTELALERARGAVVHTRSAFKEVAALARTSVIQLELPYAASLPPARRVPDGVLKLVVFGYLAANRRIPALLEAIATFPERNRLRLDIFGELDDPESVAERIRSLRLGDLVQVRGFVPETDLDDLLMQSDLAVNLRHPTMGEASHSQLRIWNCGLASLVTRTGWYAELPPDTVGFVDPATEVADLHDHFRAALARPEAIRAMGEAGRRHLETRHDPELYARDLLAGLDLMMTTPGSIVGEVGESIARSLAASNVAGAARATLVRRAAEVLCRWTAAPASGESRG
jgi:glycosyltransferase involved in cell wall biosynthesis